MNKVGDIFLVIGIALIAIIFNSLDFSTVAVLITYCPSRLAEVISLFLFLGAVGKSAQIGLHTWLPDAM